MKKPFLILASAALLLAADYEAEGQRWWSHIQVLADDSMEGRNTGSEGHRRAAKYVSQEFERYGLKASGTSGYIQPVKFKVRQIDESASSLDLIRDGKAEPLILGEDASIGVRNDPAPANEGALIFVGYGLSIPEYKFDDLAGLDLHGKIAVYLNGGPADIPGQLRSHFASAKERWGAFKKAGAVGLVALANPKSMDIPWSRASLARFQPAMTLEDSVLDDTIGLRIAVTMNPDHADKLFAGSGHTFAELLALADAKKPVPHFALAYSLRAKTALKRSEAESQNVIGVLPGTDLKNEFVVLTAHLDHVGIGEPINGDRIYNGAMDDASGIATLIEVAAMLKESAAKTRRSIAFVAVTGEEKGLLGSKFFANHPTLRGGRIVADINMDMFLPIHPLKIIEVQGLQESSLGAQIQAVAEAAGLQVQTDQEPDRNRFIRSDQYSFIQQGVPALAFKFGYVPGSPEDALHKDWLKNRYHAPSDDLNQPVDKAAAARFNRVILSLTERVANDDESPRWNKDSFFRRFAK